MYVDGSLPCPPAWAGAAEDLRGAAASKEAILKWTTKDRLAKSIISSKLPFDHLHMTDAARTSQDLWDDIVRKYEKNRSGAAVASAVQDMMTRKWESGSLEQHIAWFRSTNQLLARFEPGRQQVVTTGAALPEHVLSMMLSLSIPNTAEWGAVKANVYATSLFQFEETAARLLGESQRLQMEAKDRRVTSAAAHYSKGQPNADDRKDERPTCSHCEKRGHKADKCWTLHPELTPGYVQQRQQRRSSQRDSKKDAKKDGKRDSKKDSKRAAPARHESNSDSESSGGWASSSYCAVLMDDEEDGDEDDGTALEQAASAVIELPSGSVPASAPLHAPMRAAQLVEEAVSLHSVGIKGGSLMSDWLVDSGASLHYCHERDLFDTLEPVSGRFVLLGDGRRIPVMGCGTLKVSASVSGRLSTATLANVQYTPDMTVNLLSVSGLTSTGLEVRFCDRDCTIRRGRKVVARARKVANKLFQLTMAKRVEPAQRSKKSQAGSAHIVQAESRLAQLWHERMGHLHFAALRKLFAGKQVRDEPGVDCEAIARALRDPAFAGKCAACAVAKSTRKPFPTSGATRARRPLELIHMDVCTMPERSKSGYKHFLTIQDDASRETWAYLLRSKDEVLPNYKVWVAAAEAKHSAAGHRVLAVRSDNGGEFISGAFDTLLEERGSHRERSTPYTPEQNGVAERVNRTLLNSMRTMLHDSPLDSSFWDEALRTAVYSHNRAPSRALGGMTPHQAWSGHKPRVGHMHAFGCVCFAHVAKVGRNKLAPRAHKCVFVGYESDMKAYRLWDISTKTVIVSRDVDFWEGVDWGARQSDEGEQSQ